MQKITPFLWFDHQAEEAANFYASIFSDSTIKEVFKNNGKALTVGFQLAGQDFTALNGGPMFKFNPSISLFVVCETAAETDEVWLKLLEGGKVLMPLEKQAWSEKYGWLQDRYGLSWQISLGKIADVGQKFTPFLMFVGEQHGKAERALHFYSSIFKKPKTDGILYYGPEENEEEGTVKHAQFSLDGHTFMVMDGGATMHDFQFNEALSFVISCDTQSEVDYYWEKLIDGGGQESMCGWLKDPFGVSWQVVPKALFQLLSDPDRAKSQRAMGAMMQMRKIDIEQLRQAALDEGKNIVTVEATVALPVEKTWQLWTAPEHIVHWNNASDDWHTPRAENDLRTGGTFNFRMEAKDGSFGFDFGGVYDRVVVNNCLEYTIGDGRKVQVNFSGFDHSTHVIETFEAENMHPVEMQRSGWQSILDNFKKYAEGNK